jgi:hypothetical protein
VRDVLLDVTLEVPRDDLTADGALAGVLEKLRGKADEQCQHVGGRLRTDREPQIVVQEAEHRLTGEAYVLFATRWAAVVPESARL